MANLLFMMQNEKQFKIGEALQKDDKFMENNGKSKNLIFLPFLLN